MPKRPLFIHLLVYAFYFLVAIVVTWPLLPNLSSVLTGFVYGDAHEMAHHIWWFKHALQTGQPLFYQPLLAYPNGIEGVTLWANPLQFFPAWALAFVLPLPAAANLTLLLTMALNGWAMWVLSRKLLAVSDQPKAKERIEPQRREGREDNQTLTPVLSTQYSILNTQSSVLSPQSFFPALLAGLVFMLFPTMQGHLAAGHAGLMVQWGLPLYVLMLFRLRETGGWRNILLAALCFVLSAAGHSLQLIYTLAPVTLLFGLTLLLRREWAALRRAVASALIGAVGLGLFLIPVISATLATPAYADEGGTVRYSADLLAVVSPSFFHPLFDELDYNRRVLGINIDEGAAYIGIVAAALGLIGLVKARASRWWLALALVAWVLSLGPLLKIFDQPVSFTVDNYHSFVTLPWALVADLPLLELARTPARFNFTLALAAAALAGYGAAVVWAWLGKVVNVRVGAQHAASLRWVRAILFALLMIAIAFEYQTFFPLPTIPAAVPDEVRALSERDDVRAVFGIPWDNLVAAKYDLYLQTAHQQPLIAGQVSRRTPVNPALLTILETTLDPALLDLAGADVVIVHKAQDDGMLYQRARERLGQPFYENDALALFETPEADAAPQTVTLPTVVDRLEHRADSYVFSPGAGWVTLSASVTADGRELVVLRDNVPAHRWTVDGEMAITVPVPVDAGGYHTISLIVEPPCPLSIPEGLLCRSVVVDTFALEHVTTSLPDAGSFVFERPGTAQPTLRLLHDALPEAAQPGAVLPVWLYWEFIEARAENEIRFVHMIGAEGGAPVAQVDSPLGAQPGGSAWAEQVDLSLPDDLPPGDYNIYAGWYTYPEIANFCVQENGACAANEALIGTVQIK